MEISAVYTEIAERDRAPRSDHAHRSCNSLLYLNVCLGVDYPRD